MPAVAVVGAVASISAGAAAIGAAGFSLLAGAQIAGGVLTAVGTITGNKKLATLGAVIGLGSTLASGLSSAATASELGAAGDALKNVADVADIADEAAGLGRTAGDLSLGEDLASAAKEFETLGGSPADAAGAAVKAVEPAATGLLGQATLPPIQTPPPTEVASSVAPQPVPSPQGAPSVFDEFTRGDASLRSTQAPANIAERGTLAEIAAKLGKGAGDITDGTLSFIRKNPEASKLLLGTGNGLLSSYQRQQAAAEQAKLSDQARARYNQSITGLRRI